MTAVQKVDETVKGEEVNHTVALKVAHAGNTVCAFGVTYAVMCLLGHSEAAAEVSCLNGALCYFERDASMRVAGAIASAAAKLSRKRS